MSAALAPVPTTTPEFNLLDADFNRIRDLILVRAGIDLHAGKQAMVYSRLSRRLRATGQSSFGGYLEHLLAGSDDAPEWTEFVNCLTTNLTSFFREEHHFDALHDDLQARAGRPLRIWCNAASTGEEPYSLAMTALDSLGSAPSLTILATDVNTTVLRTASRGEYPADARGLNAALLKRHFLRGKAAQAGRIRVRPELAALIQFRMFNLMNADWSLLGAPFDIVFCRNVMIYFDRPTQRRVLERMHAVMTPGSLLYVGHSENFGDARRLFQLRGNTVYERV